MSGEAIAGIIGAVIAALVAVIRAYLQYKGNKLSQDEPKTDQDRIDEYEEAIVKDDHDAVNSAHDDQRERLLRIAEFIRRRREKRAGGDTE